MLLGFFNRYRRGDTGCHGNNNNATCINHYHHHLLRSSVGVKKKQLIRSRRSVVLLVLAILAFICSIVGSPLYFYYHYGGGDYYYSYYQKYYYYHHADASYNNNNNMPNTAIRHSSNSLVLLPPLSPSTRVATTTTTTAIASTTPQNHLQQQQESPAFTSLSNVKNNHHKTLAASNDNNTATNKKNNSNTNRHQSSLPLFSFFDRKSNHDPPNNPAAVGAAISSPPWVVFYNIYIPPDDVDDDHQVGRSIAMDIIKEQINQVRQSYANTAFILRRKNGDDGAGAGRRGDRVDDDDDDNDDAGLTIYYNVIGGKLDPQWMTDYCRRRPDDTVGSSATGTAAGASGGGAMTCRLLQHYETGHEMLTLDRVQEFCTLYPNNNNMIVIYIHTKGSFHYQGSGPGFHGQDSWRRHMTAASTSRACLTHLQQNTDSSNDDDSNNDIGENKTTSTTCNACGMLFQPFPAQHFAGNSWAAKCSYVKHLAPSSVLVPKRAHISNPSTLQKVGLTRAFFPWAPPYLGTERYLGEHWIGTLAPRLVPCDVSRHVSLGYWLDADRDTAKEFDDSDNGGSGDIGSNSNSSAWAMAPRFAWNDPGWAYQAAVQDVTLVTDTERLRREFFLLPGRLYKWWMEYNSTPPSDSWIWDWYPDGEYWKEQILQFGPEKIVDILAQQAAVKKKKKQPAASAVAANPLTTSTTGGVVSPQQSLIQSNLPNDVLALNLTTSPPFAIFYNIFIGPGEEARQAGQDSVKEQLAQIAKSNAVSAAAMSHKQPTLYYNTIGEHLDPQFVDDICKENGLQNCHRMNHYIKGSEDKTLNRVQQFCVRNPTASVVYVNNKGSERLQYSGPGFEGQDHWRRLMTNAVLGKDCLEMSSAALVSKNSTCNVCGLLFQPLPAPHFPGNMFAAKCSYVQKLHVSWELVPRRRESIKAAKSAGLLFNYFPNHAARFLSEHWMGTHPDMVPCDLSQHVILSSDRYPSEFSLSMAPRFNFSDNWAFQAAVTNRDDVLSNPESRRKEFFLLGGLLHRWIHEYDALPASDSWVWSWFVDGSFWRANTVERTGPKATLIKEALRAVLPE